MLPSTPRARRRRGDVVGTPRDSEAYRPSAMRRSLLIVAGALLTAAILGATWVFVPWHPLAGSDSDASAPHATAGHDGIELSLVSGDPTRIQVVSAPGESVPMRTVEVT